MGHAYATSGRYRVTLIVTNNNGEGETTTQIVTVDVPPTASFNPSTTLPTDATASFDASGSSDGAVGTITDYSWNFGDGTGTQDGGSTPTVSHTYGARGYYSVKLTVKNDAGADRHHYPGADRRRPPTVHLSPGSAVVTPNLPVSFDATADSDGPIATGAGTSATPAAPTTRAPSRTRPTPSPRPARTP